MTTESLQLSLKNRAEVISSDSRLRPVFHTEALPKISNLAQFSEIVELAERITKPLVEINIYQIENNEWQLLAAAIKEVVALFLDIRLIAQPNSGTISEIPAAVQRLRAMTSTATDQTEFSLLSPNSDNNQFFIVEDVEKTELIRGFLHALGNHLTFLEGSSSLLALDQNMNVDQKNRCQSILQQRLEGIPTLLETWKQISQQVDPENADWVTAQQVGDSIRQATHHDVFLEALPERLLAEAIQLPGSVIQLIIYELATNSHQMARDRGLEMIPPRVTFSIEIDETGLKPTFILTVKDYAGGFANLEIKPGQTTREGGTGTGLSLVHQLSEQVMEGKVQKDNWTEVTPDGETQRGALVTISLPLQPVAQPQSAQSEI
jgi:signal transduction histidine kinase